MGQSTSSDPLEEGSQPAAHWCRATELSAVMLSSGYCCCHAQKLGVCVHTVTVCMEMHAYYHLLYINAFTCLRTPLHHQSNARVLIKQIRSLLFVV